jgi:hypothetical protein
MAGIGTGIALHAVFHAGFQHGQAGPVIPGGEKLAHAIEEAVDQFLLFFRRLGPGNIQDAHIVQDAGRVFLLLLCKGLPGHGFQVEGKFWQIVDVDADHLPFNGGNIAYFQIIFFFHAVLPLYSFGASGLVVATSSQVLSPVPPAMCGASQFSLNCRFSSISPWFFLL